MGSALIVPIRYSSILPLFSGWRPLDHTGPELRPVPFAPLRSGPARRRAPFPLQAAWPRFVPVPSGQRSSPGVGTLLAYAGLPADDVAVSIFAGENGGAKLERKSKWSGEIICKYLVRKARLELARPKPLEPKSSASTNSATLAIALSYAE